MVIGEEEKTEEVVAGENIPHMEAEGYVEAEEETSTTTCPPQRRTSVVAVQSSSALVRFDGCLRVEW